MKAGSKGIIPFLGKKNQKNKKTLYILEFLSSLFRTRMEVAWKETEGKG